MEKPWYENFYCSLYSSPCWLPARLRLRQPQNPPVKLSPSQMA